VPVAGSAYTYGYATLGELFAWIIGWDLILEYALSATTVAIGWSGYVVSFLGKNLGIHIPAALSAARGTCVSLATGSSQLAPNCAALTDGGPWIVAVINLPAILIIALVTTLLVIGIKESANFNNVIVVIKVTVVLVFIALAVKAINPANWHPFIPPNEGTRESFGFSGVVAGAAVVFFAYIGFDSVSTAAQEAKNPQRDMPIGILASLLICTVLYITVSAIATGVMPYRQLNVPDPIAQVADYAGLGWISGFIKLGAIAGLTSVILVQLYGQSRVFFSMSNDGLLPPVVNKIHPRFRTPYITQILVGIGVAIPAALLNVREAASLVSIGTLLAFAIVAAGVMVLRVRDPNLHRPFRTPWVWFVGPMGVVSSVYLMTGLPLRTWMRLIIWLVIGMVIYFGYSRTRAKLAVTQ